MRLARETKIFKMTDFRQKKFFKNPCNEHKVTFCNYLSIIYHSYRPEDAAKDDPPDVAFLKDKASLEIIPSILNCQFVTILWYFLSFFSTGLHGQTLSFKFRLPCLAFKSFVRNTFSRLPKDHQISADCRENMRRNL